MLAFILGTSVIIQYWTAYLASKIAFKTKYRALYFVAIAIFLMGIRRSFSFISAIRSDQDSTHQYSPELIALLISILMLIGIIRIGPLLIRTLKSENILKKSNERLNEMITVSRIADESLKQFKITLDQTLDCIFMFDTISLKFFYVNRGAMDQLGYTEEEFAELTAVDIKPEFEEETFRKLIAPLLNGESTSLMFETLHKHKNGKLIQVEVFLQIVTSEDTSKRFVAIVRDITHQKKTESELKKSNLALEEYKNSLEIKVEERTRELLEINKNLKELQEQIVHNQKMTSVATLTAGLAHELNNPLQFIANGIHLIKKSLKSPDPQEIDSMEFAMGTIDDGIKRASGIISELDKFSRIKHTLSETFDPNEILENCLEMLKDKLVGRIAVSKQLSHDHLISGNRMQLQQVILNVLNNSVQSMNSSGSISILTQPLDDYFSIEIKDSGTGILEDHLSQVFDPFFTTKEPNEGAGLGLSVAHSIIKIHGGEITISNNPDKGANVYIKLPLKTE